MRSEGAMGRTGPGVSNAGSTEVGDAEGDKDACGDGELTVSVVRGSTSGENAGGMDGAALERAEPGCWVEDGAVALVECVEIIGFGAGGCSGAADFVVDASLGPTATTTRGALERRARPDPTLETDEERARVAAIATPATLPMATGPEAGRAANGSTRGPSTGPSAKDDVNVGRSPLPPPAIAESGTEDRTGEVNEEVGADDGFDEDPECVADPGPSAGSGSIPVRGRSREGPPPARRHGRFSLAEGLASAHVVDVARNVSMEGR